MENPFAGMDKKQLLVYGGIGALGVGIVVYLRYQSAQNGGGQAYPQAQADSGGGGGGGYASPVSVSAPSQGAADQYQSGLQQAEVDAAKLQNDFMGEQLRQARGAFDLQQRLQDQEAAIMAPAEKAYAGYQASQYDSQANYYKQLATKQVSCPGKDSVRIDPSTGEAYCRQKTSGGFLGIPVGDVFRTIQGFVGGVEAYAPQAGYSAGQAGSQVLNQYIRSQAPVAGRGRSTGKPQSYGRLPEQPDFGGHF